MKKAILATTILCAVFALFLALAAPAGAQVAYSGECGKNVTWTMDTDTGVLTIDGSGAMADYTGAVNQPWKAHRYSIRTLSVIGNVTGIGSYAFCECPNLASVSFPKCLASVGEGAFDACDALSAVSFGGTRAQWKTVSVGSSNEPLKKAAVSFLLLGEGTCGDALGWALYSDNTMVISGTGAMDDYESNSATPWRNNRAQIKKLVIEDGVTSIGDHAFDTCEYIRSDVSLPDSVTRIGERAFFGLLGPLAVTLGKSVTSIGEKAFLHAGVTSFTVSAKNTVYKDIDGVLFDKAGKTLLCYPKDRQMTAYAIPDGVTQIQAYAFSDAVFSWLQDLSVPASVKRFGEHAFYYSASDLTCVRISDLAAWCGVCFEDAYANPLRAADGVLYLNGAPVTALSIPDKVESIGDYAFQKCAGLTSVKLPTGLKSIGSSTFEGCRNLAGVTLPMGLMSIGDYAFCNCESLANITIPDSVTAIGEGAFAGCMNFSAIEVPGSVKKISDRMFVNCKGLSEVTLGDGVTGLGDEAFSGCAALAAIAFPENGSLTGIGVKTFAGCTSFTHMEIPDSVTSLGERAFSQCSGLTDVTIGCGLTRLSTNAFESCAALSNVTFGKNLKSLGESAFLRCVSLKTVRLPEGLARIDQSAFSHCTALKRITIPDSVTVMENRAFAECTGLLSVTVGKGLTALGNGVFSNCTKIQTITIPRTVTVIEHAFDCKTPVIYYTGTADEWLAISQTSQMFYGYSPVIVCNAVTGDLDGDGKTTVAELSYFLSFFSTEDGVYAAPSVADLDADGDFTLHDLNLLILHLRKQTDS